MTIRFLFDIEAEDLLEDGFSYGYCVAEIHDETREIVRIIEKGDCHSIEGAQNSCKWVKDNVLPELTALHPYLNKKLDEINEKDLPDNVVKTKYEVRERFYQTYLKYAGKAEFWTDVQFPVETNFLYKLIQDSKDRDRDFKMPYPLMDLSTLLHVDVSRKAYCNIPGLREHNPLHDAIAILYSLQRWELDRKTNPGLKPAISDNLSKPKLVFDVSAQDLQKDAFGFGYIVTNFDGKTINVYEKGQFFSINSAKGMGNYVRLNALPNLPELKRFMEMDEKTLSKTTLPKEMMITSEELQKQFYNIYNYWKDLGAEIYAADVMYPVEANFLKKVTDIDTKNFHPYPVYDIVNIIEESVSRKEFTQLKGAKNGVALHHAITSSCALYMKNFESTVDIKEEANKRILEHMIQVFQKQIDTSSETPSVSKNTSILFSFKENVGDENDSTKDSPQFKDQARL